MILSNQCQILAKYRFLPTTLPKISKYARDRERPNTKYFQLRERAVEVHVDQLSLDENDPRIEDMDWAHVDDIFTNLLEAGADEALMLDIHGFVSTCNATNFFIIKDDEVWTSTGQYCMIGITRGKIIWICVNKKIPCNQKNFSLFDVYAADEAFVTGSFGGITPVTKIDGRIIGKGKFGKLSKKLNYLYEQLIEEEITQKKANAKG